MTKQEIERVVRAIYQAFEALDAEKLDENFSHTETLTAFGTDDDESFYGGGRYKSIHPVQFKVVKSFRFTSSELRTYEEGDVAWFSDRPHWQIETKAGEMVDTTVRITGVH